MEVAVKHEIPLLFHAFDELLGVVNGGMELLVGIDPLAIQIYQTEIAPVVADNDAVRIQHRHYLEDEVLPQYFGDVGVAQQVLDDVLDHVG